MKVRSGAAVLAIAAAGANAQSPTSMMSSPTTAAPSVIYTTVTYDDCDTQSFETMVTITNGVTVTWCPKCEGMDMPSSTPHAGGYTTVYTTTYESLCPTGIVPATYTVTESCTEATPTWTPGPSHIPNGFTVTTKQCTVCAHTPTAVTITEPCGCEATEGVVVTPTPPSSGSSPGGSSPGGSSPGGSSPGGSSPGGSSPGGAPPAAGGSAPAGSSPSSSPSCNGAHCGGSGSQSPGMPASGAPAPESSAPAAGGHPPASPAPAAPAGSGAAPSMPTTTTAQCPGPQCRAASTPTTPAGNNGSSSGTPPYSGAAPSFSSFGFVCSVVLAAMVGTLAFAL